MRSISLASTLLALAACGPAPLATPIRLDMPLEGIATRPVVVRSFAGGHETPAQCSVAGPGYRFDFPTPAAMKLPVGEGGQFDATLLTCTAGAAAGRWTAIPGVDASEIHLELNGAAQPTGGIIVLKADGTAATG